MIVGKRSTDKHETRFLDSGIKIRDRTFQVGHFDKRDSLLFSIVHISDK